MIRFEHVSHTFPDGTSALEDVSLEVEPTRQPCSSVHPAPGKRPSCGW